MPFCINCGNELIDGANFCANCGTAVNNIGEETQRKTVYDGVIHKCPNCGDILDAYESVCEACGYERRGANSTSSVRELAVKLEKIEANRPIQKSSRINLLNPLNIMNASQLSSVDEQKISLIKSFPIPNNKEDIMEFIMLASSNIDVKVYAQNGSILTMREREVSDAWLSKLELAYQKAEMIFGDSKDFYKLYTMYQKKMKAIKFSKWQIWITPTSISNLF